MLVYRAPSLTGLEESLEESSVMLVVLHRLPDGFGYDVHVAEWREGHRPSAWDGKRPSLMSSETTEPSTSSRHNEINVLATVKPAIVNQKIIPVCTRKSKPQESKTLDTQDISTSSLTIAAGCPPATTPSLDAIAGGLPAAAAGAGPMNASNSLSSS